MPFYCLVTNYPFGTRIDFRFGASAQQETVSDKLCRMGEQIGTA